MVYKEYKGLDLPSISSEILNYWEVHEVFDKSILEETSVKKALIALKLLSLTFPIIKRRIDKLTSKIVLAF